jgi:tetratricopeptide (TPR) repeat protein
MRFTTTVISTVFVFIAAIACSASPSGLNLQDPLTDPGFVHFYNNEFDAAIADFEAGVRARPNDPESYNHLAQAILYREMLRNGALESQLVSGTNPFLRRPKMAIGARDKARFSHCVDQSLRLGQALLEKDPQNIHALYALGVAHGLRANYAFLVEKAWVDSLREAMAARRVTEQILDINPNFIDAQLILGVDDYVVGSLPFHMRALGFVAGFRGDKEGGIRKLEEVAKTGILNRYDAKIVLAVIYRRERCPQKAIPLLKDLATRFPRNYLLRFEQVEMYSDLGDKNSALRVLAEVDDLRRNGAPGFQKLPAEKINYLRGNLLFWYGDLDAALTDLKQVTQNAAAVDLGTAVMAWLRLGQVYDLKGNHKQAMEAYRETMKTAPESAAAAEAKSYMSNPYRRKRLAG